jgi:hypothetical protein
VLVVVHEIPGPVCADEPAVKAARAANSLHHT